MNTENQNLMKHFASVLRARAMGNQKEPGINKKIARYFSRKDLIEIIKKRFNGNIPKTHNLVEMENAELLELVSDDMFIICYMTEKWSKEILDGNPKPEKSVPKPQKTTRPKSNSK